MGQRIIKCSLTCIEGSYTVIFNIEALNIHIQNSHSIKSILAMKDMICTIKNHWAYKLIEAQGFTRSDASMLREWKAHNLLYNWGYKQDRTGDVDFDQNETLLRRIGYRFLSPLYRG